MTIESYTKRPRMKDRMMPTSFTLRESQFDRLEQYCEAIDQPRSKVLRMALEEFLTKHQAAKC